MGKMANDIIKLVKERAIWLAFIALVAFVTAASGYVVNGVRQARLAFRDVETNQEAIKKLTDTLHRRISKNHSKIEENMKRGIRVDERTKNFNEFWEFYERMRKQHVDTFKDKDKGNTNRVDIQIFVFGFL